MFAASRRINPALRVLLCAFVAVVAACGPDRTPATPIGWAPVIAGYDGLLFDTHAHLDEEIKVARLAPLMQRLGVMRSVLFAEIDPDDIRGSARDLEREIVRYPGLFVPFFHVDPKSPADIAPARASRVVDQSGITFRGYGEMAFYRPPFLQTRVDGPEFSAVFDFAAERDLIVMIHLRGEQMDELRRALEAHPHATVLLHGNEPEVQTALPVLLTAYPNLYYTLDTATLTTLAKVGEIPLIMMFSEGGKPALTDGLADPQPLAERKAVEWLPVIQAAPDRVMWGTDVAFGWHLDEDAYGALIDFSRRFIDQLPVELRDNYARGNAERLLGAGVSFD